MYKDEFTGLYHTHFREYDPIQGRWLSEDPAGYQDGLNLYNAYMGVNGIDPLGLENGVGEDLLVALKNPFAIWWAGEKAVAINMWNMATEDAPELVVNICKSPYKLGNVIYDASYGMHIKMPSTQLGQKVLTMVEDGVDADVVVKELFADVSGYNYGANVTNSALSGDWNSYRKGMFNFSFICAVPHLAKTMGPVLSKPIPGTPTVPYVQSMLTFLNKDVKTLLPQKIKYPIVKYDPVIAAQNLRLNGQISEAIAIETSSSNLWDRGSFRAAQKNTAKLNWTDSTGRLRCVCGEEISESIIVKTKNGPITKVGWEFDHYGLTWAERLRVMQSQKMIIPRKLVLDIYNQDIRPMHPSCNHSHSFETNNTATLGGN